MIDVAIALVLVVIAIGVSRSRRLELESDLVVATVRAVVQLAAVAAVIQAVLDNLGLASILLPGMVLLAAWTSGRRLKGVPHPTWIAALAIAVSSSVALAVLFAGGVFELEPRFLLPVAGMLIGNCMTAASLAGARLRDEVTDKTLEIEARLALGVSAADAISPYTRRSATAALVPTIDATKNVGVILLPGAFVGMLLADSSPFEAARLQLIVLFMLLGAVSLCAMVTTFLVGRAFIGSGERLVMPPALHR